MQMREMTVFTRAWAIMVAAIMACPVGFLEFVAPAAGQELLVNGGFA